MRTSALAMVLAAGCGHVSAPDDEPPPPDMPDAPPMVVERDITVMIEGIDADFVAVQSGDGAFAPVIGQQGKYTAKITSERYGVAIGCKRGPASAVRVVQRTAADGLEVRGTCGPAPAATVNLLVNLTNVSALGVIVQAGGLVRGTESSGILVLPVRRGFVEVVAHDQKPDGRVNRMVRLPPLDIQGEQGVAVDTFQQGVFIDDIGLTGTVPAGATALVSSRVVGDNSTFFLNHRLPFGSTYQTLPASLRRPGDLTEVTIEVDQQAGPLRHHRSVTTTTGPQAPLAFALPATLVPQTPELLATPSPHLRFAIADGANVLRAAQSLRDWTIELSPSYLAGATTYEMPELSSVPDAASYPLAAGNVGWSIARIEETSATPADGRVQKTALVESVIGCGDGIVQAGEACDTAGDSATCDSDCTPVVCGDGHVNPAVEQCDDADDPEGICLTNCTLAF